MPGKAVVKVLAQGHEIDISCGKGEQSFQWLATVIQQRLKHFNVLRKSLQQEQFLVTEIRNAGGELINPKDKLYEHIGLSGLTVHATIETSFPVDDWENPQLNDWMQAAFVHSVTGQQWAGEIEGWRTNLEEVKQQQESEDLRSHAGNLSARDRAQTTLLTRKMLPTSSTLVKIGDFSEADVESAFNLDWQAMTWQWTSSSWSEAQKSRLGLILKENYGLICHIFAHYAGVGQVGQRYGMSVQEFGHFLHTAHIVDWKVHEEAIERMFFATGPASLRNNNNSSSSQHLRGESKDGNESNTFTPGPRNGFAVKKTSTTPAASSSSSAHSVVTWPLMTRAHFAEALVYVAIDEVLGATPEEATQNLCTGPLTAFWELLLTNYTLYSSEERAMVRTAFRDCAHLLKQMFLQRATCDSRSGARLSLSGFVSLMRDATLLEADQEHMCTAGFLAAQLNPSMTWELDTVVFAEFVEAVSRLAIRAIASYPGLSEGKKVRMAFSMVVELLTSEANNKSTTGSYGHK